MHSLLEQISQRVHLCESKTLDSHVTLTIINKSCISYRRSCF